MNDTYIISFINGSSGRFLKHILYSLLTDNKEELKLTNSNSAHIQNFYTGSNIATSKVPGDKSIYETHEFNTTLPEGIPNMLVTHQYPDFDLIQQRFPNTKVILIAIDEDDWIEVIGNTTYKNGISILTRNNIGEHISEHELNYLPWLQDLYQKILGIDLTKPFKYDINETEKIVYAIQDIWKNYIIEHEEEPNFINPILDLTKYPNLTIVNYKELYEKSKTGRYIALEKLERLTNKNANKETLTNYEKYVSGREKFVQESMPWLLKEKPNN